MGTARSSHRKRVRTKKLGEAIEVLKSLGFIGRQTNEAAGYTLLAILDLRPMMPWSRAAAPLRGITALITFIGRAYDVHFAPNTRETIRDEAVKFFVALGILVRNPDDPRRPVNSGKTVYQIAPDALTLFRSFGKPQWAANLGSYTKSRKHVLAGRRRERDMNRVTVMLPSGRTATISPGGQNPLIKAVVEQFCAGFAPGGTVAYIGDAEDKFLHLDADYLKQLNVVLPAWEKMPDVVVHDTRRNWLLLIEAVTSDGPVDPKRRAELDLLFSGCTAGLVFVTAFATRAAMRRFLTRISWETEVWIAEDPNHLIHFNGERFLGPYGD
jgi:hypothetical protein